MGRRIVEAEQQGKRRAGYGEQLIARLSADLTVRFGRGFSPDNLENMRRFFAAYPRPVISEALSRKSGNGLPAEKSETVSSEIRPSALQMDRPPKQRRAGRTQVRSLPRRQY
ncbi:MAG: DUF1016 N-terminal domain-containing protein [Thiobacillus sp.]